MKIEIVEGYENTEVIIRCSTATQDIRKLESLLQSFANKLSCTKDGATYLVDVQDILYFESVDKNTFLYTASEVYELQLKLYEIEEVLSDAGFIRSAKSQVINIYKIASLCPDFGGRIEVTMMGGERLVVSRQYAKLLKQRLGIKN
ncbi:MAG: LytTR family transcriptional regulator DNA-binding domain-containing protein [Defluviitaleaceae bacterium]|nr:LytTR family transcriptional regulator DNA-binding domain-containing protein [Defluviitaleaceae bacterium]